MFYRSERLFLRPAWPEDLGEALQLMVDDRGVMSNICASEFTRPSQAILDRLTQGADKLLTSLLITLPSAAGAALIGGIALVRGSDADRDAGEVSLRYWLSKDYWGHGYAAEAVRSVVAVARGLGHRRILAPQAMDDRASLLVLTRAGFRPTGEQCIYGEGTAALYAADTSDLGPGPDFGGVPEARAA